MSDVVGIELADGVARAVALGAWSARPRATAELPWDPERPELLVARLREQLGGTRRLALAVGLAFLHPKRVRLPPAPAADRRAMLALEPDRFFPVAGRAYAVSLLDDESFAFATDADRLARWIEAFEAWAPVDSVEPAPLAAARAASGTPDGVYALPAAEGERGLVELRGGRVRSARRVPGTSPAGRDAESEAAADAGPLPTRGGSPELASALGAARGVDGSLETTLLPEPRVARARARRRGRLAGTAAALALAVLAALWALDRSRERTLARLGDEVARAAAAASGAVELRDRLGALDLEAAALTELAAGRPDPLPVLAALSERLPPGATVLNARVSGADWQIDGTATDAAALVPLLDRDARFRDVRVLSASSRFREGARTYETFSIAFRAAAPSD